MIRKDCTLITNLPVGVSLGLLLLIIFLEPVATQEEVFRCFNKSSDQLINVTLSCKSSQIVNVIDAKYGKNRWSACLSAVAPGDCTETMFKADECNKQTSCELSVANIYSVKCGEVNYFRIIYSCVEVNPQRILQNLQRKKQFQESTTSESSVKPRILPSVLPNSSFKKPPDPYKTDRSEKVIFAICLTVTAIALTLCLTVIVIQCCTHKRKKNPSAEEMLPDEISIVLTEMQRRPSADGGPPDTNDRKDHYQSTELNIEDEIEGPSYDFQEKSDGCNHQWNLFQILRQQIWRLKSRTAPEGHSPPICTVSQNID